MSLTGTATSSGGADDGGGASLVDGASPRDDGSAAGNGDSLADVDAGPEPPFVPSSSCKTLLQNNPWKLGKSGFYDIDPDDAGKAPPIPVYCDLALDNGGWTLVGRSVANAASTDFGWKVAKGAVNDLTTPYSLDVGKAKLSFTEIMVADREPNSTAPWKHAYKIAVPASFLGEDDSLVETTSITSILGDCKATPQERRPSMFRWAGLTNAKDTFFFRDVDDKGQHRGLHVDVWDLAYNDCEQGGMLDNAIGAVFVR